ncbi:glycosyltransferase family 2 protein [Xenorhabdus entomophaga]|uniref:glycosyltransferase family 2 protein n=1 Tax=Xenorhabdus entomophaga TaxID=3136257 RepID=UPI0030F42AAF
MNHQKEPKISVIMSVFNGEKFLSEAIDSIINQSLNNYEFIIVNDASTDTTAQILLEFQEKDDRIQIINNVSNMGLAKSLNIAISASRGEFIARMDADDYSFPDRLEKQYNFMVSHPNTIVCGTAMSIYEESHHNKIPPLSHEKILSRIVFDCPFYHPTVMIRKDILLEFGITYPEDYKKAQDYGLWVSLFLLSIDKGYRFINLPDVLLKYRIHPGENRVNYYNEQMFYAATSQFKLMSALGIKVDFSSIMKLNCENKLSSDEIVRLDRILKSITQKIMFLSTNEYKKYVNDVLVSKRFKLYSRAKTNNILGILLKVYARFLYLTNRKKIKPLL